jgi:hypothetical protein
VALGATALPAAVAPAEAQQLQPAIAKRAYVASHFALELDQTGLVGFLNEVEGGNLKADVIEFQSGNTGEILKSLSRLRFEDIHLQIGLAMEQRSTTDHRSWAKNYQRKNGAIVATDFNYEKKARREFHQALISEVTVPKLDAASKEPGYLDVTLTTEETDTKGDAGTIQPAANAKQKLWTTANFRLEIDGVDCTKVNKIDSFTVKQQIIEFQEGQERIPIKVPGKLEFPNLVITFNAASGPSWLSWFTSFVIQGNNGSDKEKTGRIVFLVAGSQVGARRRSSCSAVGIYKLLDGVFDPVNEPSAMMQAELYVEQMAFHLPPGAEPPPSP